MSAPWPSALRTRFRRCIEEGPGGRAAALRLKLSPATGARRGRAIRARGHGKPAPHRAFSEELVGQDPDIALFGLGDALAAAEGVCVHRSSVAGLLSRLGFTYKKSRRWPPGAAAPGQGSGGSTGSHIACQPSRIARQAWFS